MRHILDVCGKLDPLDTAFVGKESAKDYIVKMQQITKREVATEVEKEHVPVNTDLRKKFASVQNKGLVELLIGML